MIKNILENVRQISPLVHNITNYVTVNDCANILLACGASPIMADDIEEVEEITAICSATNINIGTLNKRTIESMKKAAEKASLLKHPLVLDPVGAGASKLRTDTAVSLMENYRFTVIRGNISEIKTLALGEGKTKGVDADIADVVTEDNIEEVVEFAKQLSEKTDAIIGITGAIDIVADSRKAYCIYNGTPMMSKVTGTGCQLSALIGAFVAANPERALNATASAVAAMGICGEIAEENLSENDGNIALRNGIIDAIYNLDTCEMERRIKYVER